MLTSRGERETELAIVSRLIRLFWFGDTDKFLLRRLPSSFCSLAQINRQKYNQLVPERLLAI
ncbi:MAG TPA: hypothetical protein DCY88_17030 [Cyanobacteria bacterium UBA11372]|nr:hypothetical protein [Cyanobacteria bacterium UBA11372]